MRRVLAILLLLIYGLVSAGCGNQSTSTTTLAPTSTPVYSNPDEAGRVPAGESRTVTVGGEQYTIEFKADPNTSRAYIIANGVKDRKCTVPCDVFPPMKDKKRCIVVRVVGKGNENSLDTPVAIVYKEPISGKEYCLPTY